MILSSKQCLLISSQEHRQFFMFDPKTTAVLHKYHTQEHLVPPLAYHRHSQQVMAQQVNKTFLSVWNWDGQEVDSKMSMTEVMKVMIFSRDGHYLFGGSDTGTVYLWEMPSGILIKKKALMSSGVLNVMEFANNHLITVSKNQVKVYPLSSLLLEDDSCPPLKQYTSMLDIISSSHARNIIAVLTHKNVTLLNGSLTSQPKQLQVYKKIDYQYATAMTLSNTKAFIGDGKGIIDTIELLPSEQSQLQLQFSVQTGELDITKPKKKKTLSNSKQSITSLSYLQTLSYLIAGHSNGELVIWHNYQVKKSLHLFKSAITGMTVIGKPVDTKIRQVEKIKPLNKYQLSKQQELLTVVPKEALDQGIIDIEPEEETNQDQLILYRMLDTLKQPQKLLRQQVSSLRTEKQQLLEANLHYFKQLAP